MSELISQRDIDDFVRDIARIHPEYTLEQFKADFIVGISRDPKFSEIRTFQKAIGTPASPVSQHGSVSPVVQRTPTSPVAHQSPKSRSKISSPAKNIIVPEDVSQSFRPNPRGGYSITRNHIGLSLTFPHDDRREYRSLFLDFPISRGVYRWTLKIKYSPKLISQFYIGAVSPDRLSMVDADYLGNVIGSCSFSFDRFDNYSSTLYMYGVRENTDFPTKVAMIPDDSFVAVEADIAAHTLSFFVDEKKLPYAISEVFAPLHFGVTANNGEPCYHSVSFRRLPSASLSSVPPRYYECFPVK